MKICYKKNITSLFQLFQWFLYLFIRKVYSYWYYESLNVVNKNIRDFNFLQKDHSPFEYRSNETTTDVVVVHPFSPSSKIHSTFSLSKDVEKWMNRLSVVTAELIGLVHDNPEAIAAGYRCPVIGSPRANRRIRLRRRRRPVTEHSAGVGRILFLSFFATVDGLLARFDLSRNRNRKARPMPITTPFETKGESPPSTTRKVISLV